MPLISSVFSSWIINEYYKYYIAAGGLSNMAAVGNNKSIPRGLQNSLVISTFKVDEGNILAAL